LEVGNGGGRRGGGKGMSRVVDAAASGCGEVAGKVVDFATTRT